MPGIGEVATFGVVVALLWLIVRRLGAHARYLFATGLLVVVLSWLCVFLASVSPIKDHTDWAEVLRGMAPELIGTFVAVVIIERLLQRHENSLSDSLQRQLELAARTRFETLGPLLTFAGEITDIRAATIWSLDHTDRLIAETEATLIRLATVQPAYRGEIEAFIQSGATWRQCLFECHQLLEVSAGEQRRGKALHELKQSAGVLTTSIAKVTKRISAIPQRQSLGLGRLAGPRNSPPPSLTL